VAILKVEGIDMTVPPGEFMKKERIPAEEVARWYSG